MAKKYGFHFEYKIKTSLREDFSYGEYFEPYTKEEILASPLFNSIGNEYKSLFNDATNFDYHKENDFLCDISEKEILPNTINILMDAVYCVHATAHTQTINNGIVNLIDDIFLFYGVKNKDELFKSAELTFGTTLNYIGVYTELIKIYVNEIKYVISALNYLNNSTNLVDKLLYDNFLKEISEKFFLEIKTVSNKLTIEDEMLSFNQNSKSFSIEINFTKFDLFIKLLENYKEEGGAKFIEEGNCFCLIQKSEKFYFSFSGYDDDKYTKIGMKMQKYLGEKFKKEFNFCQTNPNMLSYGYIKTDGDFELSPPPKKLSENNATEDELKRQYACCERKIFSYTDKCVQQENSMYIYCKYAPCKRCIPAIEEQEKKYSNFMFFAFIKNAKAFKKYLKEKKQRLCDDPKYLYTFI